MGTTVMAKVPSQGFGFLGAGQGFIINRPGILSGREPSAPGQDSPWGTPFPGIGRDTDREEIRIRVAEYVEFRVSDAVFRFFG